MNVINLNRVKILIAACILMAIILNARPIITDDVKIKISYTSNDVDKNIDLVCFILKDNKLQSKKDIVFYNNKISDDNNIVLTSNGKQHSTEQTIRLKLKHDVKYDKVVVYAVVYDTKGYCIKDFSDLSINGVKYNTNKVASSLRLFTAKKDKIGWKYNRTKALSKCNLEDLCRRYNLVE